MTKKWPLERVIYEEAQELARRRNWTVSFTLSIMWSRFKSAGNSKEAETGERKTRLTFWRLSWCNGKRSVKVRKIQYSQSG